MTALFHRNSTCQRRDREREMRLETEGEETPIGKDLCARNVYKRALNKL
jgi:hypothetical protein